MQTPVLFTLVAVWFCALSIGVAHGQTDQNDNDAANEIIVELAPLLASKKTRIDALEQLTTSTAPKTRVWMEALLEGDLYIQKADSAPVIAERSGKQYVLTDAVTGADAGTVAKSAISKIKINNRIRGQLRSAIASLALRDTDPTVRLAAVERMIQTLKDPEVEGIKAQLPNETDPSVKEAMSLALNLSELDSGDDQAQLDAINAIGVNTRDQVSQRLKKLIDNSESAEVVAAATAQLDAIDERKTWFARLETIFFGLSLGSVLAMAAIGLAITFGVMGVINMAHGEMIMLGAYTTWAIQVLFPSLIEYSLLIALPAAFLVAFTAGVLIEFLVIRHLYGRPLETLLATFGISLILQQTVRTFISPQNVPVSNPSWLTGLWQIDPALSLAINRVVIFCFCLLIFLILMWLIKYSFFGLKLRAVSQNRDMARALGARSTSIDAVTFGLGAGIAGVAGVALSQLSNVGPNMGQAYIVDSFMVVVFGGVGNLWGTLIAGLSLGVLNKFLEPWAGAVLAKVFVLVFIILFIQKYPRGLFPQRGRAAGD
jgi:urea transport system permease protein